MDLTKKKCTPCEGKGIKPFAKEVAVDYLTYADGWILNEKADTISKDFKFKDFKEAMEFVNRVADIAEDEGHHPDIHIFYNKVHLDLSTHAIGGLSENDFILSAKINRI